MKVSLTPQQEEWVKTKVASGRYVCASEVIRDALQLLEERDWVHERQLQEMREKIAVGLKQLDEGKGIPGEKVFAKLHKRSQQRRKKLDGK